jgi:DNA-binding MarR family transcriptional regulator
MTPATLDAPPRGAHRDQLRLWLRLLSCSTMIEGEIRRRLRDRFGATLPRFDVLAQLERAPDGLTLGQLSQRLMVSNGNVTGVVERLVAQGQVRRVPLPTDRRVAHVYLTEAGRAAFAEMAREHAEWIAELTGGLSAEEASTLSTLLDRLKQTLRTQP